MDNNEEMKNEETKNEEMKTAKPTQEPAQAETQDAEPETPQAETQEPVQKHRLLNWPVQTVRHVIQLISFFIFPALFITIYNAMREIVTTIAHGSFSLAGSAPEILLVAGAVIITALWGRFFCGWLCSFGAVSDLIYSISEWIAPDKPKVPESVDKKLKWLKYGVLAFVVIAVWILAVRIPSSVSPWGSFGGLVSGNVRIMLAAITTVGFIILLGIAAGSFFIERFFCRYLCPLGAVFSAVSARRLFRVRKDEKTCILCGKCSKDCSMGIDVMNGSDVRTGECIDCMKCTSACPMKCVSTNPAPAVAGTCACLALTGLVAAGNIMPGSRLSTEKAGEKYDMRNDSGERNFKDGEMPGGENGQFGHHHGHGNFDGSEQRPENGMPGRKGNNGNLPGNNGNNGSAPGNNGNDSNNSGSTAAELDLSSVKDGKYTGTGQGFRGATEVSVTVKSHKITSITIKSYNDDEAYFSQAKSKIIKSIISEQSLNVDTVSGATFSSRGILEAVANALNVSYNNPNSSFGGGHMHGSSSQNNI